MKKTPIEIAAEYEKRFGYCAARREDIVFLDFGCGADDPLGVSYSLIDRGIKRAFACDIVDISPPAFAFASYVKLPEIPPASIDFIGSHCVLEHVGSRRDTSGGYATALAEVETIARTLYEITKPGGAGYHEIDSCDHKWYSDPDNYSRFHYLESHSDTINNLPACAIVAALRKAGFEIADCRERLEAVPEAIMKRLLPEYKKYPKDDLAVWNCRVLVKKGL